MTASPKATRLIVHADDFGLSEAVNHGIIAAHKNGILTSASVMATAEAFEHAVRLAEANPSLDVGVHLTLTEQQPLTGAASVPSLVDEAGHFAPHARHFASKYLRGQISLAEVRAELDAQIRRARDHGLRVTHLDGHQHVHVLPKIAGVVNELAKVHGIRAVRYPSERIRAYMWKNLRGARRLGEQLALNFTCALSPLRLLRRTDDFAGFYFGGGLNEANLLTVLHGLPAGKTTELMCHPGVDDPRSPYGSWDYSWAAELEALVSQRIRSVLDARGVQLISWRDV